MATFSDETLLYPTDLTPTEQDELRAALREDAALAEAFRQAQALRASLQAKLDEAAETAQPGRRLLVCHALATGDHAEVLTPAEVALAHEHHARLEAALEAHPALRDVVYRIRCDADAFDEAWADLCAPAEPQLAHQPEPQAASHRAPSRAPERAADRSARRSEPQRARSFSRYASRIGLGVVALAFLTVSALLVQRDRALVTVETGAGEMQEVTLAGGSLVRLMEASRLIYVHPDRDPVLRARTRLEGAAYFEVVPSHAGLRIETPTALASVLGTAFGLRADEESTEVVVESGVVAFASLGAEGQPVRVEEGQWSRTVAGARPTTPQPAALEEALAWAGVTAFRSTPLPRAIERLEEVFGVTATYDEDLAGEAVSGTFFADDDPRAAFETLAATLGARLVEEGETLHLAPGRR